MIVKCEVPARWMFMTPAELLAWQNERDTVPSETPLYWSKDGGLAARVDGKYVSVVKPGVPVIFTDGIPQVCEAATSMPYVRVYPTGPDTDLYWMNDGSLVRLVKEHTAG